MDNEKLHERILELEERLLAVVELCKELMSYPNRTMPEADRLLLQDYKRYLKLVEYVESNNLKKVSTHAIQRYVVKDIGYRELEVCLWNLERCGLIKLGLGKNYLEIYLLGSTLFEKQKKKNSKESLDEI